MTVEFLTEKSDIMAAALSSLPEANVRLLMERTGMESALDHLDAAEQAVREAKERVAEAKKRLSSMVLRDWKDGEINDGLKEILR